MECFSHNYRRTVWVATVLPLYLFTTLLIGLAGSGDQSLTGYLEIMSLQWFMYTFHSSAMVPDIGNDPILETYEISVLPLYESGKKLPE